MPGNIIPTTPAGWPYLDQDNYLDVTPAYTEQLATKLDNADADVAAAINAATQAQQALTTIDAKIAAQLGSYGPHEPMVTLAPSGQWYSVNAWPVVLTREGKTVYMEGLRSITAGHTPQATIIPATQFPAIYRPKRTIRFLSYATGSKSTGMIEVSSSGVVTFDPVQWSASPSGFVSFHASWEGA